MKHMKNLAIKFISILAVLFIILGIFYDMSFGNVLWISVVLTLASYLIGDLLILRRTNNTMATISDFAIAFLVIWLMGENLTYGDSLIMPALIAAAGIALFETFFHKYVARQIQEADEQQNGSRNLRYQTEASSELTPRNTEFSNRNSDPDQINDDGQ
ncbi:MAG: YndM family protein [Bacillus sp. (in: firmicutes)]